MQRREQAKKGLDTSKPIDCKRDDCDRYVAWGQGRWRDEV